LGFKIHAANDRVRLLFDHDQLVPTWIQRETPSIAWDSLNVKGFCAFNRPILKRIGLLSRVRQRDTGIC